MFENLDFNNLWLIISKPDNVPVLGLFPLLFFFAGWGICQGLENDRRQRRGEPLIEEAGDKAHTWPYLMRIEFIALIIVMAILTIWSVALNAPLEEPADSTRTPNPSKAPWYFLGLQEMLVYFDPWFAGVVLPGIIIVGLIVIPYVDFNEKGAGYYTVRDRPFALAVFFFGFFGLWCAQVFIGTFMRGPGWNFFGPLETWDAHKVVFANNVDFSNVVGEGLSRVMAALGVADTVRLQVKAAFDSKAPIGVLFGGALVLGWLGLGPMSYLAGSRVARRRELVDPETNRLRPDAKLRTLDWIVGTDPSRRSPVGSFLDFFLWTLALPLRIVLALLRVPSMGTVGQVLALIGAVAYGLLGVGLSVAGVVVAGFLCLLTRWLRSRGNWQRLYDTLFVGIPGGIVGMVTNLGLIRYAIVSGLFLIMMGVPVKMVLRWTLAVKYIWVVPGVFNI
jgi:hypothetical protein